ncbi:SMC-Scp complex subunit ScpB [Thermosipho atlanticus]|uniref:Condensin subunit ScpB n=1 Tax=Thermosipho atlanticus DSM 15807 TaxID=1123380 RepID=A0A1M5QPT2_9BACT|nr:SMC-Scp complex subunit ScpB [Thermosipho atlanticus]SHH16104.1 condensin subunit ScpB [Thermosipho atlanticus DSM 15807]
MQKNQIALVEAMIFASRGIKKQDLQKITDISENVLDEIILQLQKKYNSSEEHGIELRNIDGFLRFYTKEQFSSEVSKIVRKRSLSSLSEAQLEIVLLLATKNKLTKSEIDGIRGKDSYNVLKQLLSSGVVKRQKKGRGYIYSLTNVFKDETMVEELVKDLGGAELDYSGS